jgi:hypothetical protein
MPDRDRKGPAAFETTEATRPLERSARQMLQMRYSINAPRFETMLQSARRRPSTEETSIGFKVEPNSFFSRNFSTRNSPFRNPYIVGELLEKENRLASSDRPVSVYQAVIHRLGAKIRSERSGRSNFTSEEKEMAYGSALDPRFLRSKSPRSRQYLIRLPKKKVASVEREAKSSQEGVVQCSTRRFIYSPAHTGSRLAGVHRLKGGKSMPVRKKLRAARRAVKRRKSFPSTRYSILTTRFAKRRLHELPRTHEISIPREALHTSLRP